MSHFEANGLTHNRTRANPEWTDTHPADKRTMVSLSDSSENFLLEAGVANPSLS